MKKKLLFLLIISFSSFFYAQTHEEKMKEELKTVVSEKLADELLKTGFMHRSTYKEDLKFLLTPKTKISKLSTDFCKENAPIFLIESLYLYKKPENSSEIDIKKASSIVKSISTLKGLEYYSASKKETKLLYSDAYVTDKIKNGKKLPDPINDETDGKNVLVVLEDTTLGKNVYDYVFKQTDKEACFFSSNCENLYYGIIKVINADKMKVALTITDLGDCMVAYVVISADFFGFPGLHNKMYESFSNRADAMYKWFLNRIEK